LLLQVEVQVVVVELVVVVLVDCFTLVRKL
jgi:hypothetical protein